MSYSIYIGEAEWSPYDDGCLNVAAKHVENKEAPYFSDSEYTNCRSPGYGQMAEFCKEAGIYNLWFGKPNGLLAQHPGCQKLEQHHLDCMKEALNMWKEKYPEAKPQMLDESKYVKQDGILARLVWYVWWMEWALNNCEFPVVSNT